MVQLMVNDGTVDGTPDTMTVTTLNSLPVSDAGEDQNVEVSMEVTLDGSGSNDPDNGPDPLSFLWTFVSVPPGQCPD